MNILKLLPPHVRKNYIMTQRCRKVDRSQSWFPWQLLRLILDYAKHNARSKHVEPHMDLLQTGLLPAHHCSAIISLSAAVFTSNSFYGMESVISLCNSIADESLSGITKASRALLQLS